MSGPADTLRAWLDLARISNLPPCVSNVLVGTALGATTGVFPVLPFVTVSVAVSCLYVAGMALNDAVDAPADAAARPGRPIPSGRVTRRGAFVFALALLTIGVAVLASLGRAPAAWGALLAGVIGAYDLLHRRLAVSVVLMGVCRGLVYITSAVAVNPSIEWARVGAAAGVMTLYVTVVTVLARDEAGARAPLPMGAGLAPTVVALAPAALLSPVRWLGALAVGALAAAWTVRCALLARARPPQRMPAVMGWLAGICLVDAFILALTDAPALAAGALLCFVATILGHRRIPGT